MTLRGAAQPIEGALLESAQDLSLKRQRQLANLVEEDGAALSELELARLALHRAGECPALVAEQFGLEQCSREWRRS